MKTLTKAEIDAFYYFLTEQSKNPSYEDIIANMEKLGTYKHLISRNEKVSDSFEFTINNIQKLSQLNDLLREKEQYLIDEFKKMQSLFKHQTDADEYSFELILGVYLQPKEEVFYRIGNKWEFTRYCIIDSDINDIFLTDIQDWKEPWMPEVLKDIKFCYSMHLLCGFGHAQFVTWQDLVNANYVETIIQIQKHNSHEI